MSHGIYPTRYGWLVISSLGGIALDATICDTYGEALALWCTL